MTRFEFLMGFYSLILGLALTRLMAEFADLLRSRDRGALGLLVPTAVLKLVPHRSESALGWFG